MQFLTSPRRVIAVALAIVSIQACGKSPSPAPSPVPGATTVRGTERLAWNQAGDTAGLRFTAYVDAQAVALAAATCDAATPEAACSSPLPPLTAGVHTIALTATSATSGLESAPTETITVQKVATTAAIGVAAYPDARGPNMLRVENLVTTATGLTFAVDIVARGIQAPAQLASTSDGRLIIADAHGELRVVHPGEPGRAEPALDARTLPAPPPIGPLGIARHPDFRRNHFVYVGFLAQDRPDRPLLRIIRLREVADTLGEPATIFQTPVTVTATTPDGQQDDAALTRGGPRLAFGPDGLLYIALPSDVEFDREPSASAPQPSMLRMSDTGRVSAAVPLTGITAHPLAFGWHASTGALWVATADENGEAVLRPVTTGVAARIVPGRNLGPMSDVLSNSRASGAGAHVGLHISPGAPLTSRALVFQGMEAGALDLARTFMAAPGTASPGIVRLTVPILALGLVNGVTDRFGDIVTGDAGAIFLATSNATQAGGENADGEDVVVRLTPLAR